MSSHRFIRVLSALVLACALSAASASAQEIAGEWTMNVDLDAGSGVAIFVLSVDGSEITGTYSGIAGDQQVTGTVNDDGSVTFGFESADAGAVEFRGTVDGDTMSGECEYGALGAGSFNGTRAESN